MIDRIKVRNKKRKLTETEINRKDRPRG